MYLKTLIPFLALGVVMQGTSIIGKSQGKYFQAKYQQTRKAKSKDQQIVAEQYTGRIFRDSHGRERTDEYTQDEHIVRVYDPIRKIEFMYDVIAKIIFYQATTSADGFRAQVWNINKSAIAFPTSPPQSEPELGWRDIEGVRCAGYQIQERGEYTIHYWISRDLNQLFLIHIITGDEETTWRLFDLNFSEPEFAYFDIPKDFKTVK